MATNTSTCNQGFTRERSIMIRMTFTRQFMRSKLLNSFSVSRVAKSADSSKAVIFILHTESSKALINCLARSLSEYARGPHERKLLTIDSNLAKQPSSDSPGF
jgi:hypothetical protein